MEEIFPNRWDESSKALVHQKFPDVHMDYSNPLSYDAMHFNEPGLYLFAAFLSDYLEMTFFKEIGDNFKY